jgi:hypothetical protein
LAHWAPIKQTLRLAMSATLDITAVRRVVFVMNGGIVYKNVARGAIPVYAGVQR